jgi:hypothetical protein
MSMENLIKQTTVTLTKEEIARWWVSCAIVLLCLLVIFGNIVLDVFHKCG